MMVLKLIPKDPVLMNMIAALNAMGVSKGFEKTKRAFDAYATAIKRSWQNAVGPDHKIEMQKHSPFQTTVFSRDPMVGYLEDGMPSYDMKTTHPFGKKSRLVKPRRTGKGLLKMSWKCKRKDGSTYIQNANDAYLIIPMQHRTGIANRARAGQVGLNMIYGELLQSKQSSVFAESDVETPAATSGKRTPNIWGEMIGRAKYKWGSRLELPPIPELQDLQGMVSMKGGTYLTFRVVSVNSPKDSWIHPGIKARKYLAEIMNRNHEQIANIMDTAMKKDMGLA
jgi:hypothetical protein